MRVPCQHDRQPAKPRTRVLVLLAVTAALSGGAMFVVCDGKSAIDAWMRGQGHHTIEQGTSMGRALAAVPGRLLADAPAPSLGVDIAFTHVQTLRAAQQAAMLRGHIDASTKQSVPAQIVVDSARSKAKLRLKGDNLDHVNTKKLSFRIQIDGDPPVLGLRAFSLQAPATKGFQLEALFHASVRHFGVLSPRYEFVRARYNGDDVGVMALEEHCAKELMERQGRRDSVVVRWQEEQMFAAQVRVRSIDPDIVALDDYRTAPVDSFGSVVYPQQDAAFALLRAFVAGTLAPAQVFDVEELATYLAVCELWGAWHPLRWHNLRFYFDPLSGRLAPIGFDGNLQMRRSIGHLVTPEEPVIARMLTDGEVFAAFRRQLRAVCAAVSDGRLITRLAAVQATALPILQREHWLLQALPLDELRDRAAYLLELQDASFSGRAGDSDLAPLLVSEVAAGRYEMINVARSAVFVHGLRWVRPDGSVRAAELPADWQPWHTIPGKPETGPIPPLALVLTPPTDALGFSLEVEARLDGVGDRHFVRATPQPEAARTTPLPVPDLAVTIAANPWLRLDDDGRTLHAAVGKHRVARTVVLPRGYRLVVAAGTELTFAQDAALVVQGGVSFSGHAGLPIVLAGDGAAGWLGVAVLTGDAATQSRWQHVRVRDTLGVQVGALTFTGGVVFDRGQVELEDVLLSGTSAEDALNVIRAEVKMLRVHVERTASDAFDGDFVRGTLRACEFSAIGGDAIDLSGADVTLHDCRMRDVRDKALSVGEGSRAVATGIVAENTGAGAACKDGSTLDLRDSRLVGARVASVMAYMKKPEYGGAKVLLTKVVCEGDAPVARVQHGSSIVRDGQSIASEAIDVQALYETVMRKR